MSEGLSQFVKDVKVFADHLLQLAKQDGGAITRKHKDRVIVESHLFHANLLKDLVDEGHLDKRYVEGITAKLEERFDLEVSHYFDAHESMDADHLKVFIDTYYLDHLFQVIASQEKLFNAIDKGLRKDKKIISKHTQRLKKELR